MQGKRPQYLQCLGRGINNKMLIVLRKILSFSWTELRVIYETRIVKSTYVWLIAVPIAAKFLSHLEDIISFKWGEYNFKIDTTLPFTWSILYFSALSFVLGNIIYYMKCPKIIKTCPDLSSFISAGKSITHLEEYADDIGLSIASNDHSQINATFWKVHGKANAESILARRLTSILYWIGILLILYVGLENLIAVLRLLLK